MGCDIHMYIEYTNKEGGEKKKDWQSFGSGYGVRNYTMFGILAKGVRYDVDGSFEPKGCPDDMGYYAQDASRLYISDDSDGGDYCTLEQAKEWEKYGNKIIHYLDKPTWVEHPDWHSHSWLTTEEYEEALDLYIENDEYDYGVPDEYLGVLGAMRGLLSNGNNEVRVVFWFDN